MTLTKGFITNAATTAKDARLMDLARVVANADGSARTGVLGVPGTLLTAAGTMSVTVAAAVFATSRGKADGVAVFANDGNVAVPISAAPVSNSRITSIWVKHNDDTQGDANALPVFGTTDGAAAATPVAPAIPTGAEELGQLRVYAGTTAANGGLNTLTQTYRMTVMEGGVVPFRTAAELLAWTTATDGQLAIDLSDQTGAALYMYNGAAWKRSSRVLGVTSVTPAAQSGINTETAVSGASLSFTMPTAGAVRVSGGLLTLGGDASSIVAIRLKEGATILAEWSRPANSLGSGTPNYQNIDRVLPAVTAGAHTYTLAVVRAAGGNITVSPAAATPTQLFAEIFD